MNKSELILVTGFLGAGKTTLLQSLLRSQAGKRVHLIVNEFGRIGMDGALLADLGATLDEIVNGSIFCACRMDQFKSALDRAQADGPDRIFVEASGLSDPTAIRAILEQGNRYPSIGYKGCIALADATRLIKVIDTARVCAKQLSAADLIVLNKTDLATEAELQAARTLLHQRYPFVPVWEAVQGNVPQSQVEAMSAHRTAMAADQHRDLTLQKRLLQVSPAMTSAQLRAFLRLIAEDTYRMKGYVLLKDGSFRVDCVGAYVNLIACEKIGPDYGIAVLSGEGLNLRHSLQTAIGWYEGLVSDDKE